MSAKKPAAYGGQAVLEGVMFSGKKVTVTAIRRLDESVDYFHEERKQYSFLQKLKKIPFLRGIIGLVESAAVGSKHLNFSSERYDQERTDEEEDPKTEESGWNLTMILGVAVVGVLSFIFGKLIFTVVPAILAEVLFKQWVTHNIWQNLIEGGIKLVLLLGYLLAIAQTPLVKRLFQYHGAEHKVINAFEAGKDLSVENVQAQSTLHYRCGSSFIIFTVLVGVIVYSFFNYDTLWQRVYQRILLLPLVIGVSYEVLQLTNLLRDTPVLRVLGYPGLLLQKLTTKQPEDKQVEIAIASFNKMMELDQQVEQGKLLPVK